MLKITIVTLGKLKERAFLDLEEEYLKRLRPFAKINIVELNEIPYKKEKEADKARRKEADILLRHFTPGSLVIALDEKGKTISTLNFAKILKAQGAGGRHLIFVIGSSTGLDEKVKNKANWLLSLSEMTFTHNFSRVLLEEQIYRACTIISGKIYHK
jgi:23S rRNA (pseudouridine1915-N3)-methyltransferase